MKYCNRSILSTRYPNICYSHVSSYDPFSFEIMVTNNLIPKYPPNVVGLKQTTFTSHRKWVLTHRTSGISLHHLLDLFPPHRIPTESQRDTPPSFPGNSYRCTVSLPIHHSDRISLLFITDSCRFFFTYLLNQSYLELQLSHVSRTVGSKEKGVTYYSYFSPKYERRDKEIVLCFD